MNFRSSENFHDALLSQYRELIQEAIFECETEHKTRMDIGKLNSKLQVIYKAANYDGLSDHVINQLIDEVMPLQKNLAA